LGFEARAPLLHCLGERARRKESERGESERARKRESDRRISHGIHPASISTPAAARERIHEARQDSLFLLLGFFGFFRRDYGAAGLYDLDKAGGGKAGTLRPALGFKIGYIFVYRLVIFFFFGTHFFVRQFNSLMK